MQNFQPVLSNLTKYKIELLLLSGAVVSLVCSVGIFFLSSQSLKDMKPDNTKPRTTYFSSNTSHPSAKKIVVDITGSVTKPDSYELAPGSRLKDVLNMAGGLLSTADSDFFYRNYNLAKLLTDQEKIYIPSVTEVADGIFKENYRLVDYTEGTSDISGPALVKINSASADDLTTLPGLTKAMIDKIIQNRPYQNIQELLDKKILKKTNYDKITKLIQL